MTVLPVPVLRIAPDATEKTPPQGGSPALQSAPEITPADVVEELAHNLQLCRLQTQETHLEAQDSLALATGLRTEVQHLRSQLADLESIVMRELVQDLPLEDLRMKKTKTEPPSRKRSKTVSNKKGDVLNHYKTKAFSDEERTCDEEVDSSDDEEGPINYLNYAKGGPLGRRFRGYVELQTRLTEYQGLVPYRSYRIKDTETVIDENDTVKVNGILKRVELNFSYFGGEIPLQVLDFLSTVKEAMDLNNVSEGVAAIILPYLLTGEAKDGVISMWKGTSPKVPKYPAAVAWLLESYATDAAIDAAADKFATAKQQAGEGEDAFAKRLRRYAMEAGNVNKEDALVSRYLDGLASYTANMIRGHVYPRLRFTQVKNLAEQADLAGREAGVSSRSSTRAPVPGLLTPRP
jgi:hypothetical protein